MLPPDLMDALDNESSGAASDPVGHVSPVSVAHPLKKRGLDGNDVGEHPAESQQPTLITDPEAADPSFLKSFQE